MEKELIEAKARRVECGFTQGTAAQLSGLSQSLVSGVERGLGTSENTRTYVACFSRSAQELKAELKAKGLRGSERPRTVKSMANLPKNPKQLLLDLAIKEKRSEKPKKEEAKKEEPKAHTYAGKFLPSGEDMNKHIEFDGRTLYTFTAVPGGVWLSVVGTYNLKRGDK